MDTISQKEVEELLKNHRPSKILDLSNLSLIGFDFSNKDLKNINFKGCLLHDSNFNNSKLYNVTFEDVDLKNSDFSNSNFKSSRLIAVNLEGSDLGSVSFSDSILDGVNTLDSYCINNRIENCKLINIEFKNFEFDSGKVLNSTFENCNINNFIDYDHNCYFENVDMINVKLVN